MSDNYLEDSSVNNTYIQNTSNCMNISNQESSETEIKTNSNTTKDAYSESNDWTTGSDLLSTPNHDNTTTMKKDTSPLSLETIPTDQELKSNQPVGSDLDNVNQPITIYETRNRDNSINSNTCSDKNTIKNSRDLNDTSNVPSSHSTLGAHSQQSKPSNRNVSQQSCPDDNIENEKESNLLIKNENDLIRNYNEGSREPSRSLDISYSFQTPNLNGMDTSLDLGKSNVFHGSAENFTAASMTEALSNLNLSATQSQNNLDLYKATNTSVFNNDINSLNFENKPFNHGIQTPGILDWSNTTANQLNENKIDTTNNRTNNPKNATYVNESQHHQNSNDYINSGSAFKDNRMLNQTQQNNNSSTNSNYNLGSFASNGQYQHGLSASNYPSQSTFAGNSIMYNSNTLNNTNTRDNEWLKIEVCRDHLRGNCQREPNACKFGHPPLDQLTGRPRTYEGGKVLCCFDNLKNKCRRDNCKYFHPPPHLKTQIEINGKQNLILKSEMNNNSTNYLISKSPTSSNYNNNHSRSQYNSGNSYRNESRNSNLSYHNSTSGYTLNGSNLEQRNTNRNNGVSNNNWGSNTRTANDSRRDDRYYSRNSNNRTYDSYRPRNGYDANQVYNYDRNSKYSNNLIYLQNSGKFNGKFKNLNQDHSKNYDGSYSKNNGLLDSASNNHANNTVIGEHFNRSNSNKFAGSQPATNLSLNLVQRADRLEICRDYQRSNCQRSSYDCKYAHPPNKAMIDQGDNTAIVCMDSIKKRCQRDSCKYYHPPNHLIAKVKQVQQQQQINHLPFNSITGTYQGNTTENPSLTNSITGIGAGNNTSLSTSSQVVQYTPINTNHPAQVTLLNPQPYPSIFANTTTNSNTSNTNLSNHTMTQTTGGLNQSFIGHASIGSSQNTNTLSSNLFASANTASYATTNPALQQSFHSSFGTSALGGSINAGFTSQGNYGTSSLGNSATAYGTSSPSLQQSMMLFPSVTVANAVDPNTTTTQNASLLNAVNMSSSTNTFNQTNNIPSTTSTNTITHSQNNNDKNKSVAQHPTNTNNNTNTIAFNSQSSQGTHNLNLTSNTSGTAANNLESSSRVSHQLGSMVNLTSNEANNQYQSNDLFSQIGNSDVRNTIFDRNNFTNTDMISSTTLADRNFF